MISVITPAFNEKDNLRLLYERIHKVFSQIDEKFEWVIIDDHSNDLTYDVIKNITQKDNRVRGYRLAKNYGAQIAIKAGLNLALGDCAIVMAADLQDPPETIPKLIQKWKQSAQIVWAARTFREGETIVTKGFSRFYYWLMKKILNINDLPSMGADYFLLDREIIESLKLFQESNGSILSLLHWMGYRQTTIYYVKQERKYGQSGWTFRKKMRLLIDSVLSFSHFPIRFMTYVGMWIALIGFLYACFVFNNALSGIPIPGWSSLIIVITLLGGFQLIMGGIIGEYLWRVLDESRRRPQFLIEATTEKSSTD